MTDFIYLYLVYMVLCLVFVYRAVVHSLAAASTLLPMLPHV